MKIGHQSLAIAAIGASLGLSGLAQAEGNDFKIPTTLSYSAAGNDRQTWNTVLIVSGVVLAVGLIQSENTLTILGAAGVALSLIQLNKTSFRPQYSFRGLDLVKRGPVAFGISPFGDVNLRQGFTALRPSAYLSASFRF